MLIKLNNIEAGISKGSYSFSHVCPGRDQLQYMYSILLKADDLCNHSDYCPQQLLFF